jgi:Cytochrome P450
LRDDPEMIRSAVEELLRYESPVQYTGRILKEDMELCGVRLRRGEVIAFMLGAANRDPQQFTDPCRLNLARLNNAHLAFGAGPHFCNRESTCPARRAGGDSANGPTVPSDAIGGTASRLGTHLWFAAPKNPSGCCLTN